LDYFGILGMIGTSRMSLKLIYGRLALATWLFAAQQTLTVGSIASTALATPTFHNDRILVLPKPARMAATTALHSQFGAKVLSRFPSVDGLQSVGVPKGTTVQELIMKYQASGTVVYAEPDFSRTLDLAPNDPQYTNGTAWGLFNFGQSGGVVDADIDANEAWDVLDSASNIVVAIIDSGIRRTHEDLSANIWTNASNGYGWDALNNNESPADGDGHGTLMAGIIGAVGNNNKGSTGVAWRVRLQACRSFATTTSGFDSDIIEGIEFARTNGAKVINMSLSGTGFSSSLSNAIFAAREAGIIVVASAGNEASNVDVTPRYPACYQLDNIISVGASTRADALWSSSNFGATNVDLVAPGHQITSTFFLADSFYLGPLSGSSFSAAYVSGACALLRARYSTETPQQIIARMLNGVDILPSLAGKCTTSGRLNLRKALSPPINLAFHSTLNFMGQTTTQWRITAGPTRNFVVEASTNLTSWSPVYGGTTSASGTADFFDPLTANHPRRFYRVVAEH
jgi:subtilisin family serine protease